MQRTRVAFALVMVLSLVPVGTAQTVPETDNTVTRIDVQADGDAAVSVRVRTRLENDSDLQVYRRYQETIRENRTDTLDLFRDRITGVVGTAADSTGRPMRARNFSVSTTIQQVPRRWGVVEYSFRWTAFARTDDEAVVVDQVFGGGLFIEPDDTLVVTGPEGYAVDSVDPAPTTRDNGTLRWRGQYDFGPNQPSVRYVPSGSQETVTPTADNGLTAAVGLALLGVVGLAVVVGYLLHRRPGEPAAAGGGGVQTDEDRVVELLRASGGQVKQAGIADELDWSASKTSRVVSSLDDEGRVEKLRLGRENVISLPESDEP